MAMTKAEKALLQEYRNRAALTLPPYEEPQPLTEEQIRTRRGSDLAAVVWFQNLHNKQVTMGWSTGSHHGTGTYEGRKGSAYISYGSRRGHAQCYGSEQEAWRAMRWQATRKAMDELGWLDAHIAGVPIP